MVIWKLEAISDARLGGEKIILILGLVWMWAFAFTIQLLASPIVNSLTAPQKHLISERPQWNSLGSSLERRRMYHQTLKLGQALQTFHVRNLKQPSSMKDWSINSQQLHGTLECQSQGDKWWVSRWAVAFMPCFYISRNIWLVIFCKQNAGLDGPLVCSRPHVLLHQPLTSACSVWDYSMVQGMALRPRTTLGHSSKEEVCGSLEVSLGI